MERKGNENPKALKVLYQQFANIFGYICGILS